MQKLLTSGMILLLAGAATIAAAADPNSTGLLRRGQVQLDAGEYSQAAEYLRLACFGLLDEPATLAECLVPLALAYDQMERGDEFRAVFERVVEVEERFTGYTDADLTDARRQAFEAAVKRHMPQTMLGTIPVFAHLVPTEEDRVASMDASERRRHFEDRADAEPNEPRWRVELARLDLAEGRTRRAERHLEAALASAPDDPEANLAMARIEANDRRWSAAARHFEASGKATATAADAALYLRTLEALDELEAIATASLELSPAIAADPAVADAINRSRAEIDRREQEAQVRAEAEALAAAEAERIAAAAESSESEPTSELQAIFDDGEGSTDDTQASNTTTTGGPADEMAPPAEAILGDVQVIDLPSKQDASPDDSSTAAPQPDLPKSARTLVRVDNQTLRNRSVVTLTFDGQIERDAVSHWRLSDPPRHMISIRGIVEKRVPYQIDFDGRRVDAVRSAIHSELDPVEIHVVIDRSNTDVVIDSVRVAGRVIMIDLSGGR